MRLLGGSPVGKEDSKLDKASLAEAEVGPVGCNYDCQKGESCLDGLAL